MIPSLSPPPVDITPPPPARLTHLDHPASLDDSDAVTLGCGREAVSHHERGAALVVGGEAQGGGAWSHYWAAVERRCTVMSVVRP